MPTRPDTMTEPAWLSALCTALAADGYFVLENVLSKETVAQTREAMLSVQLKIVAHLGQTRLDQAGERGVLRLMLQLDPFFLKLLEIPQLLAVVDAVVSPTAVMHLQNGFIYPPNMESKIFQG